MAILYVVEGPNTGTEHVLKAGSVLLGRRSTCDIQIQDPKSSRKHCEIISENGKYFLNDLGSTNGTKLNGRKITGRLELSPSDRISIGKVTFELREEASGALPEIPGYKIEKLIGSGGTGRVFKALHIPMDRTVAIKILHEKFNKSPRIIEQFIREARAVGKLNHPNIIQVHDVSKAAGIHFFSMEYVDGESLRQRLKQVEKLDPGKALDIVLQTSRALEYAHQHKIIHRDIKPDNILLTRQNVVKLLDLGIAKMGTTTREDGSKVSGTPHYMSPEQCQGKEIDARTDIYSLGAVFYEILTGEKPFTGDTAKEILKAHLTEEIPAIQELNDKVPDAMVFVIEKMMAKNPEKRYSNMTEIIADLKTLSAEPGKAKSKIKRVQPGDSVISQAVRAKPDAERARKRRRREQDTGKQAAVVLSKVITLLAVLLFGIVVYIVYQSVVKNEGLPAVGGTPTAQSQSQGQTPGPVQPLQPAATVPAAVPIPPANGKETTPGEGEGTKQTPAQPTVDPVRLKFFQDEWQRRSDLAASKAKGDIDGKLDPIERFLQLSNLPAELKSKAEADKANILKVGDELFNAAKNDAKNASRNNYWRAVNILQNYIDNNSDKRYRDQVLQMISKYNGDALKEHDRALRRARSAVRFFQFDKGTERLLGSIRKLDNMTDENGKPLNDDLNELVDKIGKVHELMKYWMKQLRGIEKHPMIPFDIEVQASAFKKWRIHSAGIDEKGKMYVNIVPAYEKSAAGHKLEMAAFNSEELYQLLMLYLKDKMTVELHGQMAVLCEFRKLKEKQEYHLQQSGAAGGN